MKPKTMILMVVAVSCGLGASYMTSRLLADRDQAIEKVPILVAKKNLSMGDQIKVPEDLFEEKQFAKGDEPRLAINEVDRLKGKVLKRSLRAGDFVTVDDLFDEKGGGGIWANLPPGHVAVGIRVSAEGIAGGFASLPHSRVNLIWTVRRGNDKDSFSKILLENVLVLAADTQTIRNETNSAMLANVVTVALKHEDSMKLELAKNIGTLSLVLRKFNDNSHPESDTVTVESLLRSSNTAQAEIDTADPSPPPPAVSPVPVKDPSPPLPTPVAGQRGPNNLEHTLTVIDGTDTRHTNFLIDPKSGRVISPGTTRQVTQPNAVAAPTLPTTPAPAATPKKDETPDGGF